MRIVFSRDRPAQLDLLLRSLKKFTRPERTEVIWYGSTDDFVRGYMRLGLNNMTEPDTFDADLRIELARCARTVTFFCDDDVVIRPVPIMPFGGLNDEQTLCFSWRLASAEHKWEWPPLPRTDHGYPGSIDGHTFRARDVENMIAVYHIDNPTMLETVLARECETYANRRPLMAAWHEQLLVGVPVNRVSEPSGCPYGETYPQPTEDLNEWFLDGNRIALDAVVAELRNGNGCHREIALPWESA